MDRLLGRAGAFRDDALRRAFAWRCLAFKGRAVALIPPEGWSKGGGSGVVT